MFKGIKKVVIVILFPIIFPITMLYLAVTGVFDSDFINNDTSGDDDNEM